MHPYIKIYMKNFVEYESLKISLLIFISQRLLNSIYWIIGRIIGSSQKLVQYCFPGEKTHQGVY